MRSEIKGFGTIVSKILYEICENPTHARFIVSNYQTPADQLRVRLTGNG